MSYYSNIGDGPPDIILGPPIKKEIIRDDKFSTSEMKSVQRMNAPIHVVKLIEFFKNSYDPIVNKDSNFQQLGQLYEQLLRPVLEKEAIVVAILGAKIDTVCDKDKKIKNKTKNNIRQILFEKSLVTKLESLILLLKENKLSPQTIVEPIYTEYFGIYFLLTCFQYVNYKSYSNTQLKDCYNIIISSHKFIEIQKTSLSTVLINDMQFALNKLKEKINFKYSSLFLEFHGVLLKTKYDSFFNQPSLHFAQQQLLQLIKENDNALITYNTAPGSGKTIFSSVALASYAKMKNKQLLFCCHSKLVLLQVATYINLAGIPFEHAYLEESKDGSKYISSYYSNSYYASLQKKTYAIIASVETAIQLLKQNMDDYILCVDEVTIGADNKDSIYLQQTAELMSLLPKLTILMSATINFDQLKLLYEFQKEKYPEIKLFQVSSHKIEIQCSLQSFSGSQIVPHYAKELQITEINSFIQLHPLFGRFYTTKIVEELYNNLRINSTLSEEELEQIFLKHCCSNNFKLSAIRDVALELLEIIGSKQIKLINPKEICSVCPIIDIKNLGTSSAKFFNGLTLIVSDDPVEFALSNFRSLYDCISEYNSDLTITKLINNHNKLNPQPKKGKEETTRKFVKSALCDFIENYQINTKSHYKKFNSIDQHFEMNFKEPLSFDFVPFNEIQCDDFVLVLLLCGVGIISNKLPHSYQMHVMERLENNSIQFIISDIKMVYGVNYSISNVVIADDFYNNHSIESNLQLIGRAGRFGLSDTATVFMSEESSQKFYNYIKNPNYDTKEKDNIEHAFKNVRHLLI